MSGALGELAALGVLSALIFPSALVGILTGPRWRVLHPAEYAGALLIALAGGARRRRQLHAVLERRRDRAAAGRHRN